MKLFFCNRTMEKGEMRRLISWFIFNHGTARTTQLVERLKILGFYHATKAGISLSVDDLKIPPSKKWLIEDAENEIQLTERRYQRGSITAVERFQKLIDTWHSTSETLKDEVVEYFVQKDRLNPVYMMAFSGARGNLSQVRQLVGMRGLMSDPQGQIIDLPIRSNFREGLTVTEYIISCYGARKGLVDTALRTADSGYLTRRLVDVAQHVIVRETDCGTKNGIAIRSIKDQDKTIFSLEERIISRVIAEDILFNGNYIARINQDISPSLASQIVKIKKKSVLVRSPLTCKANRSVCQLCYGWSLAHGNLVDLGEAVGIIAAQSIGEPGTQLTMRTFHTGGVFTGNIAQQIRSPIDGKVVYCNNSSQFFSPIRTRYGETAFITTQDVNLVIVGVISHELKLPINTIVLVKDQEYVQSRQLIAEVSISNRKGQSLEIASKYVSSDLSGEVYFENLLLQEKKIDSNYANRFSRAGKFGGLIWILSGSVSDFSVDSSLGLQTGDYLKPGSIIQQDTIQTINGGQIRIFDLHSQKYINFKQKKNSFSKKYQKIYSHNSSNFELHVVNSSSIFPELKFFNFFSKEKNYLIFELELSDSNGHSAIGRFISGPKYVKESPSFYEFGKLITETYLAPLGGIVRYSNLRVQRSSTTLDGFSVLEGGTILLIPEESYILSLEEDILFVSDNQFIRKNTLLFGTTYSKNEGLIEIENTNENKIILRIKLGKITFANREIDTSNSFVQPGSFINDDFVTDDLYQIDLISNYSESILNEVSFTKKDIDPQNEKIVLIRPVFQYKIDTVFPYQVLGLNWNVRNNINVDLNQRILYQDGERILSHTSLELVHISLISFSSNLSGTDQLSSYFIFNSSNNIQFSFEENLDPKSFYLFCKDLKSDENIRVSLEINQIEVFKLPTLDQHLDTSYQEQNRLLIKSLQYCLPQQIIACQEILIKNFGEIRQQQKSSEKQKSFLLLNSFHFFTISQSRNSLKLGDFYIKEYELYPGLKLPESGQLIQIQNEFLTFRVARPYLVSSEAILHVNHGDLVQTGDTLVMLIYEQSKTGDIIQGLPRIEELLEARRTKGLKPLPNNLHSRLELSFYRSIQTYGLNRAVRKSLEETQLFLVNEIQLVYKAQGVNISDKHVEIIVRQMTSKVLIEEGGDTTLLPGELIEINRVENLNRNVSIHAQYKPIVLGITKASLNTESFISAASFQETTRVLTKAAIEGKTDWLRGLKENVIIGRLIPAGTGFNEHEKMASNIINLYNDLGYLLNPISEKENLRYKDNFFEEIILNSNQTIIRNENLFSFSNLERIDNNNTLD